MTKSRTAHRLPDISAASALYLGDTAIDAAYLGSTSVFASGGGSPSYFTGGTVTDVVDGSTTYRTHTFTTSGTLTFVEADDPTVDVEYLVVAGGGGAGSNSTGAAGGGGGGGLLTATGYALGATTTITVGAGGAAGASAAGGSRGSDSSLGAIAVSTGGGGGQGQSGAGTTGGSGGGGAWSNFTAGTSGTVGQGNAGGTVTGSSPNRVGGGGGGAGSAGGGSSGAAGGTAGSGSSVFGSTYAAGAQGGQNNASASSVAGTANTGNGGYPGMGNVTSAAGGSGIVIVRYPKTTGMPDALPGLDWHSLYWTDGSDFKGLGLSNGATVTTWPNETAETNLVTNGGSQTYISADSGLNGRPSVNFVGSSGSKMIANGWSVAPAAGSMSFVLVHRPDVAIAANPQTVMGGISAAADAKLFHDTSGNWGAYAGTATLVGGTSTTNASLTVAVFDGSTGSEKIYFNGTDTTGTNAGSGKAPTGLYLGNISSGVQQFDGAIAFAAIYEGDITADPLYDDLIAYLADHYGVTLA